MKLIVTLFALILLVHSHILSQDVKIGNQVWMSKNLDVSNFRNGEEIPQAKNEEQWNYAFKKKIPAWCYYEFDEYKGKQYGKLYNAFALIDQRGLSPIGYKIPAIEELKQLIIFLGGDEIAGKFLKSKDGWNDYVYGGSKVCPNCIKWTTSYREKVPCNTCFDSRSVDAPKTIIRGGGVDSKGFNALPGGFCDWYGNFMGRGEQAVFWSITPKAAAFAPLVLNYYSDKVENGTGVLDMGCGFSVRCIKTNTTIDNNKDVKLDKKSIKKFFEK
jgi:uncharacterized protein (TIGR02145 family)